MARFYATFDNTVVNDLIALSTGNRFARLAYTNGAALKAALESTRSALSTAMYAQMDAVNRNGALGIVVPRDGYTQGAGSLSFTNLYTNTGAIYPTDPRPRPIAPILIAGSTVVSPADSGSITESLYTDATTAVQNALAGIAPPAGFSGNGPYARPGNDPQRTMLSLWHDHALTYFGWDDFTPGQANAISPNATATSQLASNPITIPMTWTGQYPADLDGLLYLGLRLSTFGGSGSDGYFREFNVTSSAGLYEWVVPGGSLPAGSYTLNILSRHSDSTITTSQGAIGTWNSGNVTAFVVFT